MSAPLKVTDAQIQFACQVMDKRRDLVRQARMYPTLAQLARELGCSERHLLRRMAAVKRPR